MSYAYELISCFALLFEIHFSKNSTEIVIDNIAIDNNCHPFSIILSHLSIYAIPPEAWPFRIDEIVDA